MAEGSDWAFSWFKQSPNQTLEKQTLTIFKNFIYVSLSNKTKPIQKYTDFPKNFRIQFSPEIEFCYPIQLL